MKRSGWVVIGLFAAFGFASSGSAQTVDKEVLEQDLEYVVEIVSEVHPAFVEVGRREALADRADALLRALPDEVPRWRIGVTVAELLREADDGHTQTDAAFGSSRFLPLQFAWLSDGLIVAPVTGTDDVADIPVASEVLSVGGLDTVALETRLSRLISENRYWVREIGSRNLSAESVLRWLGAVKNNAVTLTVRTPSGEVRTVEAPLSERRAGALWELSERLLTARGLNREWTENNGVFAWEVNGALDYGVFWLRTCDDTSEYRRGVAEFFEKVAERNIKHVVISVQQNDGGVSSVIDALLAHLPVDVYISYTSDIRLSRTVLRDSNVDESALSATPEQLERLLIRKEPSLVHRTGNLYGFASKRVANKRGEPVFGGDVYVLADAFSFSSGMWVATVLSDNHLATSAGEPTGGTPTNYGAPLEFRTPNLHLLFYVSHRYWKRPDLSRDPADALMPDIPLLVTVKDVQTGHSPVLRWLESLNRPQSATRQ